MTQVKELLHLYTDLMCTSRASKDIKKTDKSQPLLSSIFCLHSQLTIKASFFTSSDITFETKISAFVIFDKLFRASDVLFRTIDKRFSSCDIRFEAKFEILTKNDIRFDTTDRRFEANDAAFEVIFKAFNPSSTPFIISTSA